MVLNFFPRWIIPILALLSACSSSGRPVLTTSGFVVYGANATAQEEQNVFKGDKFVRQCFVMAALYMKQLHPSVKAELVHGTTTSWDGRLIAHAWVKLPSRKVFDGVEQEFFDKRVITPSSTLKRKLFMRVRR